jgi:arylsulfatase A-like enzyme
VQGVIRQRLMEGATTLVVDPAYVERPFRGLVRHRVGADVYGRTVPGTYVASLYDKGEPSVFDIRRAWLLRGKTRVHIPGLELREGDALALDVGHLASVLPRGALRPDCSLAIEVSDADGRSLGRHTLPLRVEIESKWTRHRIPLQAAAGRAASIDLQLDGYWCSSDDHALVGDVQLEGRPAPSAPERPNVLLIWVDKLRADLVNPETALPGHMPFLSELAKKGVLFTQARANSSNTFRSTVQTLLSDPNSEALAGEHFTTNLAAPMGVPSLPSVLASAGYHTTCLGANIHIARVPDGAARRQVDVGFDRCSIDYRTLEKENDDARINREQVAPWLERELRAPFFLNLHYDGAHEPYPSVDRKHLPERFASYLERGKGDPQAALYLYKAELFDQVLRDTFEMLEKQRLLDNTLVVLASDHGGTLGPDHRYFTFGRWHDIRATHAGGMYDEQIRVMLLFLNPRLTPGVRTENVQLLDLAPTILDFLGLPAPTQFVGRSRLLALTGGPALPDEPMFLGKEPEYVYGLYDPPYKYTYWLKPQERWTIDPAYVPGWDLNRVDDADHAQFVRQIESYRAKGMPIAAPQVVVSELFNLVDDPRELNNLVGSQPELAQAFQARIERSILNQRVPEYALDEARETIAFAAPERALYEGTVQSDGPLKLSSALEGCDPWHVERQGLNTLAFRCGASSKLAGFTFYRRDKAAVRFTVRRDGVLLTPSSFFLGPDGLPSPALQSSGDAVVLAPEAQPVVSARTPELVAQRDSGVFIYRQLRAAGADEDVGQGELNRAFAAWGYRQ